MMYLQAYYKSWLKNNHTITIKLKTTVLDIYYIITLIHVVYDDNFITTCIQ